MAFARPIATALVALFTAYQWFAWGCLDPSIKMLPPRRRRVVTVSLPR